MPVVPVKTIPSVVPFSSVPFVRRSTNHPRFNDDLVTKSVQEALTGPTWEAGRSGEPFALRSFVLGRAFEAFERVGGGWEKIYMTCHYTYMS